MALDSNSKIPKFQITRPKRARFNTGGFVGGDKKPAPIGQDTKVEVFNFIDTDELFDRALSSKKGVKRMINFMNDNANDIKGVF